MLSQIWTLQAASGGPTKTLADWGAASASLSSRTQSADVLSLSLPVADAVALADLWPWETEVILRRDGVVYYRGYLASHPRSLSPQEESVDLEFRSHWWLLERLTYRQNWTSLTGSGLGPVATGRVALGRDAETPDAAAMFSELTSFCASMGVALTINLTDFIDMELPLIEAHNRTVAELIRDILRWFPGVALIPVYDEVGTTYRLFSPSSEDLETLTLDGSAVTDLSISPLPEMQVDAVRLIYETTARRAEWEGEGDDDVIGGFASSTALVAATDTYPVDAVLTRRSLVLTLPHPELPPDPVPQVLRQPVATVAYPADGATNSAARRWWLDRSGLGAIGIVEANIVLPSSSSDTVLAHRVILDPATAIEYPPSPINPESTPVWTPPAIADVPRELVAGSLADWMRKRAAPCIAQVTIGVSTSAVAALSAPHRAAFLRLGPKQATVSGTPAWLLDSTYRFTGTNALTKTYVKIVSVDYGDVDGEERAAEVTEASYLAAISTAVVPGLARRLYDELSVLRYQGSCRLSFPEIPPPSYLGRRLRINHADRPEWATMEARIQSVSANLASGSLSLQFGPPEHLSPQDWVEMHECARRLRERRETSAGSPQTAEEDASPISGQIGATISPNSSFQFPGGGTTERQMWDLVAIDGGGGTFQCHNPRIVLNRNSVSSSATITGNSFTPTAGNWVFVKINHAGTTSIEMAASWTGSPNVYEIAAGTMTWARIPLWEFVGTETPGTTLVADGVWARRFVGTGALRRVRTSYFESSEFGLVMTLDLI